MIMKKLLLLMLVALTAVSGAKADTDTWYFYYWDGSSGKSTAFTSTGGNTYSIEGIKIPANSKVSIYKNNWEITYSGSNVTISNVEEEYPLAKADQTDASFGLGYGAYNITLDTLTHKISFSYRNCNINETSTEEPTYADGDYNFYTNRTLTANKWQTICLPVWFGSEQINYYFGTGSKVAEFSDADGNTLQFTKVTVMDYNKPYLVYPTNPKTLSLAGSWVSGFEPIGVEHEGYTFIGTNKQITLSSGEYYLAGGNLHQQKSKDTTIKGTRAYFTTGGSSPAREIRFTVDGVVTDIQQVVMPEEKTTGVYYNLEGQNMGTSYENLPAGLYIINNKKIVKQ